MRLSVRRVHLKRSRERKLMREAAKLAKTLDAPAVFVQALVSEEHEAVPPVEALTSEASPPPATRQIDLSTVPEAPLVSTSRADRACDPDGEGCETWVSELLDAEPVAGDCAALVGGLVLGGLLDRAIEKREREKGDPVPSAISPPALVDDEDAREAVNMAEADLDEPINLFPEDDEPDPQTHVPPSPVLREVKMAVLRATARERVEELVEEHKRVPPPPAIRYPRASPGSKCATCSEPAVNHVGMHDYCVRCSPTAFKRKPKETP